MDKFENILNAYIDLLGYAQALEKVIRENLDKEKVPERIRWRLFEDKELE